MTEAGRRDAGTRLSAARGSHSCQVIQRFFGLDPQTVNLNHLTARLPPLDALNRLMLNNYEQKQ